MIVQAKNNLVTVRIEVIGQVNSHQSFGPGEKATLETVAEWIVEFALCVSLCRSIAERHVFNNRVRRDWITLKNTLKNFMETL